MGIFDFVKGSLDKDQITKIVADSGANISDLGVEIDDKSVSLSGTAASEGDRKKAIDAVKGVEGVADVKDNIQVKGSAGKTSEGKTIHKVKYGDTLWGLAQHYYGDGSKYMTIFEANKEVWKNHNYDPNVIYPDWELVIP